MTGKIEKRLARLGLKLPAAAIPFAQYVPYVVSGRLVFVSGQLPVWNGERRFVGKLGREYDTDEGREAARLCALNLVAQLRAACGGDLDRVVRCVRLGGFVNSTAEFDRHHEVMNGASGLVAEVFGEAGRHARFAVGVPALPFGLAVEVEGVFEIDA